MNAKIDQTRLGFEPIESSHWLRTAIPLPPFPGLTTSVAVDVAVIGGGYTGLSAAIETVEGGKSVALIEARQPGWAASGRNAAQVCPMLSGTTPAAIAKALGPTLGARTNKFIAASGKAVFDVIRKYDIDCNPRPTGNMFVARSEKTLAAAIRTAKDLERCGAHIEIVDKTDLHKFVQSRRYVGGVRYLDGGTIQPLSFARGLALAAGKLGVSIFGDSTVTSIVPTADGWRIRTEQGDVSAKFVLLGTGAYLEGELFPELRETGYPVAAACLVSHPLPDRGKSILPLGGPVVDLDDRAVFSPSIDAEGRVVMTVLAGGNVRSIADVAPAAERRLKKAFPQLGPVRWDRFWLGRMTVTPDHLPRIIKLAPGIYAGTGCQGLGITYATGAGRELGKLALGVSEDLVDIPVSEPKKVPMARTMPGLLRHVIFPLLNRIGT